MASKYTLWVYFLTRWHKNNLKNFAKTFFEALQLYKKYFINNLIPVICSKISYKFSRLKTYSLN